MSEFYSKNQNEIGSSKEKHCSADAGGCLILEEKVDWKGGSSERKIIFVCLIENF